MLKRWLQDEVEDKVPPFATHQVGVAGMVMDASGRMLLVKEWRDTEHGRVKSEQWKYVRSGSNGRETCTALDRRAGRLLVHVLSAY